MASTLSLTFSMKTVVSLTTLMFARPAASFAFRTSSVTRRAVSSTGLRLAEEGQAEVVLVGCGAPNRGVSTPHTRDVRSAYSEIIATIKDTIDLRKEGLW